MSSVGVIFLVRKYKQLNNMKFVFLNVLPRNDCSPLTENVNWEDGRNYKGMVHLEIHTFHGAKGYTILKYVL